MIEPLVWATRPVSVQTGDYADAQTIVTEHFTRDGRFTVRPTGAVSYRRDHGFHGALNSRFRWTGYRLTDAVAGPAWQKASEHCGSVGQAKARAARRTSRLAGEAR